MDSLVDDVATLRAELAACSCQSGVSNATTISARRAALFNTTWDTTKVSTGSSNTSQIQLPLESTGTYNFTVWWGDGTQDHITTFNDTQVAHTYAQSGVYMVVIEGTIKGWGFNAGGDRLKLSSVLQWGSLSLGNSGGYFWGAANLEILATDTPNLTGTTNMARAFRGSGLGELGNLNDWDVSKVCA